MEDFKHADKGYFKETRVVDGIKVKIEMYASSSCPGHLIRDAITGEKLAYRVGSLDEHLFFTVLRSDLGKGRDLVPLFYSSPEEYERHQLCEISNDVKEMWRDKKFIRMKEIENQKRKSSRIMSRQELETNKHNIYQEHTIVK